MLRTRTVSNRKNEKLAVVVHVLLTTQNFRPRPHEDDCKRKR